MQVIYKSVLAFKNCQTVFRSHSSGALPVLAITGFRFCCKTNGKPYNLAPLRVPERALWRALWEGPLGPLWGPLGRSSRAFLEAFRGSKNIEDRH